MKLLVIGGTRFVGRGIVDAALANGHEVTLFNRGRSNADLFPEVEKLVGDRDGGLDVLQGRTWDAVIDSVGYVPRLVRDSAELLKDSVKQYTYISSISVFNRVDVAGIDEDFPKATIEDETTEEVNDATYGALKYLNEVVLEEVMPGRALHIRSGLVVGPHDHSDRLLYWAHRVARGGEVLATGNPARQIQFIDARDLGRWAVYATEQGLTGPYISTGPAQVLTMGDFLQTCKKVSGSDATFTWVSDNFLPENGINTEETMPWWLPDGYHGYGMYNTQKALAAGIQFRPLEETIRDTLAWHATRPADHEWQSASALTPEREKELLGTWHANN